MGADGSWWAETLLGADWGEADELKGAKVKEAEAKSEARLRLSLGLRLRLRLRLR